MSPSQKRTARPLSADGFVRQLARLFSPRERVIAGVLAVLILIGAVLEAAGAGLVFPFISAVDDPALIEANKYLRPVWEMLGQPVAERFLMLAAGLLMIFYILKNLFAGVLTHLQNRFVYRKSVRVADDLLRTYMHMPYEWHLGQNTAKLLRNVNAEVHNVFGNIMVPLFIVVTETTVAVALVAVLVLVAPVPALVVILLLGGTGAAFYAVVRRRLRRLGREQQHHSTEMIRWINQALGGLKEARVLGREQFFANEYHHHTQRFAHASQYAMTINQLPKLFIETVAIGTVLAIVVVVMSRDTSGAPLLPVLGLFAMASLRLIPSLNRIVASITRVAYYRPALDVVDRDLRYLAPIHPAAMPLAVPLTERVELHEVTYHYPDTERPAVNAVSLTIPRGRAVALVGPSGSGKTTLVDVILGLLEPQRGALTYDGRDVSLDPRAWQSQIGYVPQVIYLSADSIRRNVAFGIPTDQISEGRVWEVLETVQLADFVRGLPDGLETDVGERGVRLSGGQRQRIGLARALYHNPEVLVLDEATSALDRDTERAVAEAIERFHGQKTLIIIAHRLETIERCDSVVEIRDGRIAEIRENNSLASVASQQQT